MCHNLGMSIRHFFQCLLFILCLHTTWEAQWEQILSTVQKKLLGGREHLAQVIVFLPPATSPAYNSQDRRKKVAFLYPRRTLSPHLSVPGKEQRIIVPKVAQYSLVSLWWWTEGIWLNFTAEFVIFCFVLGFGFGVFFVSLLWFGWFWFWVGLGLFFFQ